MKKLLILICVTGFFVACKKNTPPAPVILDVVGKWTLYSWQQGTSFDVNATQYPCMSNNILQLNADGTSYGDYIGTDTCYVTPPSDPTWTIIGVVGQAPVSSTWSRSGNDIYISGDHYVVSSSGGKLYLTYSFTITQGVTTPLVVKIVDVKE